MKSLPERIMGYAEAKPEATSIQAEDLLHFGDRAAVSRALSRLARSERLMRIYRGIYMRPIETVTARWIEPDLRQGLLKCYAADAERKTLVLLDQVLDAGRASHPGEPVRRWLLSPAARDIAELHPQLEPRADELRI